MKYSNLFAGVIASLFSFAYPVFGQTGAAAPSTSGTEPEKPKYDLRVYVDQEEKTYVQKSLPLYMKFSTSPDENAKDYTLKSQQSAKYTNPMYLDTEGLNWIRHRWAVDPATGKTVYPKEEAMFEVYADGQPPVTSIKYNADGVPRYISPDGKAYYGRGLVVSLNARDRTSGVQNIHASEGGSPYQIYEKPFDFSNVEGTKTLLYFANDMVGNVEETQKKSFTIDLSPPVTTFEILSFNYENEVKPEVKLKLLPQDKYSGIKNSWYSIDDAPKAVYNGNKFTINWQENKEHDVYYHSIDNVGNEEDGETISLMYNGVSPICTAAMEGDRYETEEYTYISRRTQISFKPAHPSLKHENIYYRVNELEAEKYEGSFSCPGNSGFKHLVYYSHYYEPHQSFINLMTVFLDRTHPSSYIEHGEPQFFTRDTLFVTSKTHIELASKDQHSGIKGIFYSPFPGNVLEYKKPFHLHEEGEYELKFWGTDNVNNEETHKISELFVDNTPPEIYVNFSIAPIGTRKRGSRSVKIYPNYTRMYIGATDKSVGVDKIFYAMNDDKMIEYSSAETLDVSEKSLFKKNNFYKVKIVSTDKLGNKGEKTVEFFVEK